MLKLGVLPGKHTLLAPHYRYRPCRIHGLTIWKPSARSQAEETMRLCFKHQSWSAILNWELFLFFFFWGGGGVYAQMHQTLVRTLTDSWLLWIFNLQLVGKPVSHFATPQYLPAKRCNLSIGFESLCLKIEPTNTPKPQGFLLASSFLFFFFSPGGTEPTKRNTEAVSTCGAHWQLAGLLLERRSIRDPPIWKRASSFAGFLRGVFGR